MSKTILPGVVELTWKQARPYVANSCPELFSILDEIDPPDEYTLLKVQYPFGSLIMGDDTVYFPKAGNNLPLGHPDIPMTLKEKLGYQSVPFGMITHNTAEIYKETDNTVFSVELSGPDKGIEIGIFEYFGLTPCYSVSAGARSLYMIPKISEARQHKKLTKHFHLSTLPPKNIFRHWHLFKDLYQSDVFKTTWETEILFLTKPWAEGIKNNKSHAWERLLNYIYKKGFQHSELGRRKLLLEIVWQKLGVILANAGFKSEPYIIDTFKHVIDIFLGGSSGSRPAIDNHSGPITEIQRAYLEFYNLDQVPTIMNPCRFSLSKNQPVYYSMQTPMVISPNMNFRKINTIIEEMREFMMFKTTIVQDYGNIKINNARLHDLLKLMKLEFYHSDLYSYGREIRPASEIPLHDPDFLYSPINNPSLKFADNGSFIRGCIKISRHDEIIK